MEFYNIYLVQFSLDFNYKIVFRETETYILPFSIYLVFVTGYYLLFIIN